MWSALTYKIGRRGVLISSTLICLLSYTLVFLSFPFDAATTPVINIKLKSEWLLDRKHYRHVLLLWINAKVNIWNKFLSMISRKLYAESFKSIKLNPLNQKIINISVAELKLVKTPLIYILVEVNQLITLWLLSCSTSYLMIFVRYVFGHIYTWCSTWC